MIQSDPYVIGQQDKYYNFASVQHHNEFEMKPLLDDWKCRLSTENQQT